MENFDLTFDVKTFTFTHEPTGYTLNAESLFYYDNPQLVIDDIREGTGVEVDEFFVSVLKDTVVPF